MHPILLSFGPITIHTYGFMIAMGFLMGVQVVKALAQRSKLPVHRVIDMAFWLILVGFVGARILFIITAWDQFEKNPMEMFRVWNGGLVFYGGLLTATVFGIWFIYRYKLPIWRTVDVLVPGLTIAHVFGRLGCFSAGCCYGRPTDSFLGVSFPLLLGEASLQGVPLHPTQLYESTSLLILFFGLLWVYRKRVFDGQVAMTYFMAYPIIRSIIETFRGDIDRKFVIEDILSTSQFISIWVFFGAAIFLYIRLRQVGSEKPNQVKT